jgi:hypothetical protein
MLLEDARQHYYSHTGSLSNVNRQLCFAGVAVVWIFSIEATNGSHSLPAELFSPLKCFVLGLAFDLCQYITASASWGIYHRYKEKTGISDEEPFGAPREINWLPNICLWLKSISTLIGYYYLFDILNS